MAFLPELRAKLGAWLKTLDDGAPISLNLKTFTFDPVNIAWYARNGYPQIYSNLLGSGPTYANEVVTRDTALTHPVVWACNRIISETIGYLPASLMQDMGKAGKRVAKEHPMFAQMHDGSDEISAQSFRETLTSNCLLEGGGYAQIIRRSGREATAIELRPLLPETVTPDREKDGRRRLVYVLNKGRGESERTITVEPGKPQELLHIRGIGWDGVKGYSVIAYGRQSFATALAQERTVGRFYANGARRPYVIELPGKFRTDAEFQEWRVKWDATYSDPGKAFVLENGATYKATGDTMVEAQQKEAREFEVSEICRWFSVSPHLVADLSRATFSNIEQLALEFVKLTLSTWISRWEQDFRRCVLTADERAAGYFLKHNVNALLRGDFQTRMAGYASALQNGFLSIDEVRDLEDRNPLPGGIGADYHIQLNMQTVGQEPPPPTSPPQTLPQPARTSNNGKNDSHFGVRN